MVKKTKSLNLNFGPQHPAAHGVLRLILELDGEVVEKADPHIGLLHRGTEKLIEQKTYTQALPYFDRLDYVAPMNQEHAFALAAEKLLNIEVPERANWIRMILVELNRLSSHFMFVGAFGVDTGVFGTPFLYSFRERERLIDFFEEISGDRMMYAYFRPGGLAWDVPSNFEQRIEEVLHSSEQGIKDMDQLLTNNEIFLARTKQVGIINRQDAIDWGMSGPSLRASGVDYDIRKAEPYLYYDQIDFDVITAQNGDVFDRYFVRLQEMKQSISIVRQCLKKLVDGSVLADGASRNLRTPPGEVYIRTEAPRGEYGIYLISDGDNRPYRLKIRSAGFSNLQALRDMVVGAYIPDAVVILGSIDIVLGEVDR